MKVEGLVRAPRFFLELWGNGSETISLTGCYFNKLFVYEYDTNNITG